MGDGNAKPKAKKHKQKLNDKQALFVSEYLKDKDASNAARRAGYSQKNADVVSVRLMKLPQVKAAIDQALGEVRQHAIVDAEFVLGGLRLVAEKCTGAKTSHVYDSELKDSVEVRRFDSAGANRSLELLGKHLKLLTDRVEHVNVNVAEDLSDARERLKRASG